MSVDLPIVSLDAFSGASASSESKKDQARHLVKGFTSYGMVLVRDHDPKLAHAQRALKAARELFALDEHEKKSFASTKEDGAIRRGYLAPGQESGSELFELKEGFSYGFEHEEGFSHGFEHVPSHEVTRESSLVGVNRLRVPNRWPNCLGNEWRKALCDLYSRLCELALAATRAVGLGLGIGEDGLANMCCQGSEISLMRCFHYFQQAGQNMTGSSAHTDWGFLTVILPEPDKTGLEVFHADKWQRVSCSEGHFLVNCGDYLSLITHGRLVSPLHRVVLTDDERISFVLFFYPDYHAAFPQLRSLSKEKVQELASQLSIFHNQALAGSTAVHGNLADASFGDFIASKWEQVSRS